MAHLTIEAHIISLKEDFKMTDDCFSIYKYYSKNYERINYLKPKIVFTESRDVLCKPENLLRNKLHQNIIEMEVSISKSPVISAKWLSKNIQEIFLADFTRFTILYNDFTGDAKAVKKDATMCKRGSADLNHVTATASYMATTYKGSNIMELFTSKNLFYTQKQLDNNDNNNNNNSLNNNNNNLDIINLSSAVDKSFLTEFPSTSSNKINLLSNHANNMLLAWTSPEDPRQPGPQTIATYFPGRNGLELMSSGLSQHSPLLIQFSKRTASLLLSLEHSNESFFVTYYNIQSPKIKRVKSAEIEVKGIVMSCDWSMDENKVTFVTNQNRVFCSETRSTVTRNSSTLVDAYKVKWHASDCLIIVASSAGDFQLFDLALNALKILSNGVITDVFVLSPVLKDKRLQGMHPNKHSSRHQARLLEVVDAVSFVYEGGPVVMIMIHTGIHSCKAFNSIHILNNHLRNQQHKQALCLLEAIEWGGADNDGGEVVYCCLVSVVNHLLRLEVNDDVINDIQSALSKFFSPANQETASDYRRPIENLARRFFHLLLRHRLLEKGYLLALDLKHKDLFMDLYFAARSCGETAMADVCRKMGGDDDDEDEFNFTPDDRDSVKSIDSMDSLYDSCYGDQEDSEEDGERDFSGLTLHEDQSALNIRRYLGQHLNCQQ